VKSPAIKDGPCGVAIPINSIGAERTHNDPVQVSNAFNGGKGGFLISTSDSISADEDCGFTTNQNGALCKRPWSSFSGDSR
jgi:hypothetical protein